MSTDPWILWLVVAPLVVAGGAVMLRLFWWLAMHETQYYVRAPGPAGPPKCPQCDYNLYHAEDNRCPECGRTFEIQELDMRLAEWDGKVLRPKQEAGGQGPPETGTTNAFRKR